MTRYCLDFETMMRNTIRIYTSLVMDFGRKDFTFYYNYHKENQNSSVLMLVESKRHMKEDVDHNVFIVIYTEPHFLFNKLKNKNHIISV